MQQLHSNDFHIPQEGLQGLKKHWKSDLLASVFVFVMSLPFCFSVAFGAELSIVSGLITAIVGGLVINFIGGASMSIKMPTIGLVPIIIWGIHHLGGGYPDTGLQLWLAVLVLAGIFQMILGLARVGDLLALIPDVVIYGLLSTIAIDIFARQLHYLIGVIPTSEGTFNLLMEFPSNLIYQSKPDIIFISAICLTILFISTTFRKRHESILPASMAVLIVAGLMGWYLDIGNKDGSQYLVLNSGTLPSSFQWPEFSRIYSWEALEVVLVVALFSSLESLLNIKSVEALDFYRRKSNINRELMALGFGNILCGLLGGMPMSSSMVQSAANINSGARTRWSGFFVAVYLGGFFILFTSLLGYLPWVVFSSVLVYLCHHLLSKRLIHNIREIGKEQFLIYICTIIATLGGGLLIGLLVGWICSLIISLYLGATLKSLFVATVKVVNFSNGHSKIAVKSAAVASNYLSIRRQISKIPKGNQIYLDFSKSDVVDYSLMELIYHHPYNYNTTEGSIELQGIEEHDAISEHPLSTRILKDKSKKNKYFDENLTRFNERQLDVLAVASINNAKLRPNLTYDGHKLQGFSFSLGYDLKYRENKFNKNYYSSTTEKSTKIEFSDVFLSRGLRMSDQSRHVSVILITDLQCEVPNFTLNKENILAKMLQTVGYSDINFDAFPRFSEYYLLQGRHEEEIRSFFDERLLRFLEVYQDFSIECKHGKILIHRGMHLMNRIEIEDVILFVEDLLKLIYHEETDEVENALVYI
jgi:MFS superfamily sulfate permease-like transporter